MTLTDLYSLYLKHPIITTDSRNCPPNSIFFALKGENFNGNAFARKALEQGCEYAVVDESEYAVNQQFILVDDCLKTLQNLANRHRKQFKGNVIGITGTNGKTTTKELLAAVLSKKYKTRYTEGNLNNHIGVPLTLLRLTGNEDFAVIEMGANHPGEIKMLCNICEPDFGLITNVGKAHLEGFGSFEGVIKTKSELYDFIRAKKGKIFIRHENRFLREPAAGIDKIEYGTENDLYITGALKDFGPFLSFEWKAQNAASRFVQTRLIGAYNLENVLAAVAVGTYFGVESSLIDEALGDYTPRNNRSQLKKTERNSLIIDAYNANPSSMAAALSNFEKMKTSGPKAVILGDMLELGEQSAEEHQKIVDLLDKSQIDKVFLTGDCFVSTKNKYRTFRSVSDFISEISEFELNGFTILIKGSRGLTLEKVIEHL